MFISQFSLLLNTNFSDNSNNTSVQDSSIVSNKLNSGLALELSLVNKSSIDKQLVFNITSISGDTGNGNIQVYRTCCELDTSPNSYFDITYLLTDPTGPLTINQPTDNLRNGRYSIVVTFTSDAGGNLKFYYEIIVNHFGKLVLFENATIFKNSIFFEYKTPSTGNITFKLGTPGSNFQIDSFFDITYKIDSATNIGEISTFDFDTKDIPDNYYLLETTFEDNNLSGGFDKVITYTGLELKSTDSDPITLTTDIRDQDINITINSEVTGNGTLRLYPFHFHNQRFTFDSFFDIDYRIDVANQPISLFESTYNIPDGDYKLELVFNTDYDTRNHTFHKISNITLKRGLFSASVLENDSFFDIFYFSFKANQKGIFESHLAPVGIPWTTSSYFNHTVTIEVPNQEYFISYYTTFDNNKYDLYYSFIADGSTTWYNKTVPIQILGTPTNFSTNLIDKKVFDEQIDFEIDGKTNGKVFGNLLSHNDIFSAVNGYTNVKFGNVPCCTSVQYPYQLSFPSRDVDKGNYTFLTSLISRNVDNSRLMIFSASNITILHPPVQVFFDNNTHFSDFLDFRFKSTQTGNITFQVDSFFDIDYRIDFSGTPNFHIFSENITKLSEGKHDLQVTFISDDGKTTRYNKTFDVIRPSPIKIDTEMLSLDLISPGPITVTSSHVGRGHVTVLKASEQCPCPVDTFFDVIFGITTPGETVSLETPEPFSSGEYILHTSFTSGAKSSDAYFVKVDRSSMNIPAYPIILNLVNNASFSDIIDFRFESIKTGNVTFRLGPPGSNFQVDSFFDIDYRIEYAGKPNPHIFTENISKLLDGHYILQTSFTGDDGKIFVFNNSINVKRPNPIQIDTEIVSLDLTSPGPINVTSSHVGRGHVTVLKASEHCPCTVNSFFDIFFEITASGQTVTLETTGPFSPGEYILHTSFTSGAKSSDAYFVKVDRSTISLSEVDTTPPTFTLHADGLTFEGDKILIGLNQPITIKFTTNEPVTGLVSIIKTDSKEKVGDYITIVGENFGKLALRSKIVQTTSFESSFVLDPSILENAEYIIKMELKDKSGNVLDKEIGLIIKIDGNSSTSTIIGTSPGFEILSLFSLLGLVIIYKKRK
jgi:hypothetical protein